MLRLWILFWVVLLAGSVASATLPQQVHLLGFVERRCPDESNCFKLRVEADFIATAGDRVIVRFDRSTLIFDPENYELTLEQSNIVDGSHLRLLLASESSRGRSHFRALVIWIGD